MSGAASRTSTKCSRKKYKERFALNVWNVRQDCNQKKDVDDLIYYCGPQILNWSFALKVLILVPTRLLYVVFAQDAYQMKSN